MLETEMRDAVSSDPEYLNQILFDRTIVLDEETGYHIEESILLELEKVRKL